MQKINYISLLLILVLTGIKNARATEPDFKPAIQMEGNKLTATPASNYQWFCNGNEIASANSSTINVTNSGWYSVLTNDENGKKIFSDSVYYSCKVLKENDNEDISVIRYPVNSEVIIKLNKESRGKLSLIDADGNKLEEEKIYGESNEYQMSLSRYSSGLYMVVYTNEKGKSTLNSIIKL